MTGDFPTIAPDWAVFFDVDGTLLDYAPRPENVVVPDSLRRTLNDLRNALAGAVALVSGRKLDEVERLFAPLRLPVAGQHGAERRRDGVSHVFAPHTPALDAILARVAEFVARHPAIWIEDKGRSVAVHFRGAEGVRDALEAVLAQAVVETGDIYHVVPSHLGFDIKSRTVDKGSALAWFMAAPPFAGRVPVFVGDAGTDEDGFAAALARGGHAIKIGDGETRTAARWHLPTPAALRAWLERSVIALERPA